MESVVEKRAARDYNSKGAGTRILGREPLCRGLVSTLRFHGMLAEAVIPQLLMTVSRKIFLK